MVLASAALVVVVAAVPAEALLLPLQVEAWQGRPLGMGQVHWIRMGCCHRLQGPMPHPAQASAHPPSLQRGQQWQQQGARTSCSSRLQRLLGLLPRQQQVALPSLLVQGLRQQYLLSARTCLQAWSLVGPLAVKAEGWAR